MAEVIVSGPLFDGRAANAAKDFARTTQHEVAKQAKANVSMLLDQFLKDPTPYYEGQLFIDWGSVDIVKNRVKKYGPWLEGTGSKNAPKTHQAHPARGSPDRVLRAATVPAADGGLTWQPPGTAATPPRSSTPRTTRSASPTAPTAI
jgi:hypothetical protein